MNEGWCVLARLLWRRWCRCCCSWLVLLLVLEYYDIVLLWDLIMVLCGACGSALTNQVKHARPCCWLLLILLLLRSQTEEPTTNYSLLFTKLAQRSHRLKVISAYMLLELFALRKDILANALHHYRHAIWSKLVRLGFVSSHRIAWALCNWSCRAQHSTIQGRVPFKLLRCEVYDVSLLKCWRVVDYGFLFEPLVFHRRIFAPNLPLHFVVVIKLVEVCWHTV